MLLYNALAKKVNAIQAIQEFSMLLKIPYHDKYNTTDFHKFSGMIFDKRLKQPQLTTRNDLKTVE